MRSGIVRREKGPTLRPADEERAALVPPAFGWISWLLMLAPVLVIPAHHYPYYLTMPLGFAIVAVAPAAVHGLADRRWRIPVAVGLLLYACWFPVNTHLAFERSSVTRGASLADALRESTKEVYPEIAPGTTIILDGIDEELRLAIFGGRAFEIWYPGTKGAASIRLRQELEQRPRRSIPIEGPVVVLRKENGGVRDVTDEFEALYEREAE
jgi:hypothetical protein